MQRLHTKEQLLSWHRPLPGGTEEIKIDYECECHDLSEFLTNLGKHYGHLPRDKRPRLILGSRWSSPLSGTFQAITRCAKGTRAALPFSELILGEVNEQHLVREAGEKELTDMIVALNETPIQRLYFKFSCVISDVMIAILQKPEINLIHYLFITTDVLDSSDMRWQRMKAAYFDFQKTTAPYRNRYNLTLLRQLPFFEEEKKEGDNNEEYNDSSAPKIKLKELIVRYQHGQAHDPTYDQFINIEAQHIEQEEAQEAIVIEEAIVEQQQGIEEKQEEEQHYNDLSYIDYHQFIQDYCPYGKGKDVVHNTPQGYYKIVETELFASQALSASCAGAISFLSPTAATVISSHISVFSSLNFDNLPLYFQKKVIPGKGRILDYDEYTDPRETNPYTPLPALKHDTRCAPIFKVELKIIYQQQVGGPYDDYVAFIHRHEKHLINIFILYGDEGLRLFHEYLQLFEGWLKYRLRECLIENYLNHFPHWDHFLNEGFRACLEQIAQYEPPKQDCLIRFLERTGSSHHNLQDTVRGFEVFWEEWLAMSRAQKVDPSRLAGGGWGDWETGCGHPLVYMERLITILRNARNLDEQLKCFRGEEIRQTSLNTYGVFLASKYENFKVISREKMRLTLKEAFYSPRQPVYAVTLEGIAEETSEKKCFWLYRFIGQQQVGISIDIYSNALEKLIKNKQENSYTIGFIALLFVTHERYCSEPPLSVLLEEIGQCISEDSAFCQPIKNFLFDLYKKGHRFNSAEGLLLIDYINEQRKKEASHFQDALKILSNDLQADQRATLIKLYEEAQPGGEAFVVGNNFKRTEEINQALSQLGESSLAYCLREKVKALQDFSSISVEQVVQLIPLMNRVMAQPFVQKQAQEFIALFEPVSFKTCSDLQHLFSVLEQMAGRSYLSILKAFFSDKESVENPENYHALLEIIRDAHAAVLPTLYIEKIVRISTACPSTNLEEVLTWVKTIYKIDQSDALLHWIMTEKILSLEMAVQMMQYTKACVRHRETIKKIFIKLHAHPPELENFLQAIGKCSSLNQEKILEIIACSEAVSAKKSSDDRIDYQTFIWKMREFKDRELHELHQFFDDHRVAIPCLARALESRHGQTMASFLDQLEKSPFGERDNAQHFDISQVERVVNGLYDMRRKEVYPYAYRKQVMEAFLFVNEVGYRLKIYNGKSVVELSNSEIKALFQEMRSNKLRSSFSYLTQFQRRLCALSLIREAMYRITSEFPYSTQIIAVIDCMMHECSVLSEIKTGQGKSLIDAMKTALLWLDGVAYNSTAATVDAKRDLEMYSPFFSLLGIDPAKMPITSQSRFEDCKADGANYGTMSQFALFHMRSKADGREMGQREEKKEEHEGYNPVVSLVMNESDYTTLEDTVIYRLAMSNAEGVGVGNEWIYAEINAFVLQCPEFKVNNTSKTYDILKLKQFLKNAARRHQKSPRIVEKFSDERLLKWIESAILVNYSLRENVDYVVYPPREEPPEEKQVGGVVRLIRSAKILAKDGKVTETQYGNGMHQLLHAKLNTDGGKDEFAIEQENKTIISINHVVMIRYFLARGRIWGSSATLGDESEIERQCLKYGFACTRIEPHQPKNVRIFDSIILPDEFQHFQAILKVIERAQKEKPAAPVLVFLKDIDTAKRFFKELAREKNKQLYTGVKSSGKSEEEVVWQAAQPGTVTVTTAALGRNTDILYDKKRDGLIVINGFTDTPRKSAQRDGRTDRQGSGGEVHHIFNEKDLNGRTLEQVAQQLKQEADRKSQFNDELYGVIGVFLECASTQSGRFFREQWADFSARLELRYRASRLAGEYRLENFVQEAVRDFNGMFAKQEVVVTEKQVLDVVLRTYPQVEPAVAVEDKRKVKMEDCVPSHIIMQALFPSFLKAEDERLKTEAGNDYQKKALSDLKQSLTHALGNYSENEWWVNDNRKEAAQKLIREINQAHNSTAIMELLQTEQLAMMKTDIAENKICWRKIKSLHGKGYSRFQRVVNEGLQQASNTAQICKLLFGQLQALEVSDKYNSAVITESINVMNKVEREVLFKKQENESRIQEAVEGKIKEYRASVLGSLSTWRA
ncbi:MAG: secA 1 [Gammaproteobacteria bacterium]|jgi:hypothetical protein|nr:secA 1 [Gammaproteobacteria bacterium]